MRQDQIKIMAELLTKMSKVNPFGKMILNCQEVEEFQDEEKTCKSATQE